MGATMWHGPHHVAQKSTMVSPWCCSTSNPNVASVTADGATIVSLPLGDVQVELLEPRDPHGPVAKFLAKRGPGIHHVCYRVPDLDQALERCRAAGYRLIDEVPRRGSGGRRIAFVHPKTTAGILMELTE